MRANPKRMLFPAFCLGVVVLYGAASTRGWGGTNAKDGIDIPASVRQSPGGYRSFHYWRGGK